MKAQLTCGRTGTRVGKLAYLKRDAFSTTAAVLLVALVGPAEAAQELNGRKIFFGDTHFHTCLSHDSHSSIDEQYTSLLYVNNCDFAMHSEHAETWAIEFEPGNWQSNCQPGVNSAEHLVTVMKQYCNAWTGRTHWHTNFGLITFAVFPGYEWAPEDYWFYNCGPQKNEWCNLNGEDSNADDHVPGHINYFFDGTTGWEYDPDVWGPYGDRRSYEDILGQLIHQRDDPNRRYDLLIQINHPAASKDTANHPDVLTKWSHFTDSNYPCRQGRLRYGVNGVEWYAHQESALGSTRRHNSSFHHQYHQPDQFIMSRALKEGFKLAAWGGSDSHDGTAGGRSLTAVYATGATRPEIWAGLKAKRAYALSRFQVHTVPADKGNVAVHKGRVDFTCVDGDNGLELGMGQTGPASPTGSLRNFTITAAAEVGNATVYPADLRLYRVNRNTILSSSTRINTNWLHEAVGGDDPGKFGELLGRVTFTNPGERTASWNAWVNPGDAIFAVVYYSDNSWTWDPALERWFFGNPTLARTTPIWFEAVDEHPFVAGEAAIVAFTAAGGSDWLALGGSDTGIFGDDGVLKVGGSQQAQEWREYKFYLPASYNYCRLDFFTLPHFNTGSASNLFAVRIDGELLYSGRGAVDHPVNQLNQVTRYFPLQKGLHTVEVHMDDEEYIESGENFSCNLYEGPYGFVDALRFSTTGASSVVFYVDGRSSCRDPVGRRDCDHNAGPFKQVSEGRDGAGRWDLLRIRTGYYNERLTFDRPLRIDSYDGPAVIGRAP